MRQTVRAVAIAAGLIAAPIVVAQVNVTQSGQALDASPRVGSGGYNPALGNRGFNSQLYVTGQVTGLGGFRGRTGYRASDELRLDLPSAQLETFQRQSVGVGDAAGRGRPYQAAPYYRRSSTALGLDAIASGRNQPGSNVPRRRGDPSSLSEQLYRDATRDYAGLMARRPRGLLFEDTVDYPGAGSNALGDGSLGPSGHGAIDLYATGAINLPRARDRQELAKELHELFRVEAITDAAVQADVDAAVREPAEGLDDEGLVPLPRSSQQLDAERTLRGGPDRRGGGVPGPDQDVLVDLLIHLRQRANEGIGPQQGLATGEKEPTDTPGVSRRIVEISKSGRIVIRALAGKGKGRFNQHMGEGDKLLREGKYYDAVREYNLATIINSANPMARMGLGLAYFAAGEPLTAAFQLRRAFRLLPSLMETRFEVRRIVSPAGFDSRMQEINHRIDEDRGRRERALLFLATFMNHNSGQRAKALQTAKLLDKLSKEDRVLQAYATHVLTGQRPGKARPAAKPEQKRK